MSTSAPQRLPIPTVLSHVAVPLLLGIVMALGYLGGFHNPQPHGVRLDIVGQSSATKVMAQDLQEALGDKADVRVVATPALAERAIEQQQVSGAYVPSTTAPHLMLSSAASDTSAIAVERMLGPVALKQGLPLQIDDVVPTSGSDPSGQTYFFYFVALTVGGYGSAIAVGAAGATRSLRDRLTIGAGVTVTDAVVVTAIARFAFGAFEGHYWSLTGLAALYAAALMLFGIGLHSLIGRFTTLAMASIFVALNFTTCGGVFAVAMQPTFFATLHDFWIGSGMVEAARKIVYFPGMGVSGDVVKVLGWIVAGALLVLVAWRKESATQQQVGSHRAVTPDAATVESESDRELEEAIVA